jgi:hypothetical protein
LSEKLFRKIPKYCRPKQLQTNRRFIGAGSQPPEPVGFYHMPLTWTNRIGKAISMPLEVILMKTLDSGATTDVDLISRMGTTYMSVEDKFVLEICF